MTSPSSRSITHDTMNRRPNPTQLQRASHVHAARLQPNLAHLRRAPNAPPTRLQRICSVAGKARRTHGFLRRFTASPKDSLHGKGFYARMGGRRAAARYGRLAQRERRSLTRTRSGVQIPHRPPEKSTGRIVQAIRPVSFPFAASKREARQSRQEKSDSPKSHALRPDARIRPKPPKPKAEKAVSTPPPRRKGSRAPRAAPRPHRLPPDALLSAEWTAHRNDRGHCRTIRGREAEDARRPSESTERALRAKPRLDSFLQGRDRALVPVRNASVATDRDTIRAHGPRSRAAAGPHPYLLPLFGAQSRRPGTAPPAISQRYRLATVA